MPKRPSDYGGSADVERASTPSATQQSTAITERKPHQMLGSSGLRNSLHGNVFQLKLLMLFLIQGIGKGYQFELVTEMPGLGGKFDDLVFRYKEVGDGQDGGIKPWHYRYLQAKHKQDEKQNKITVDQLLKDNNGDFSLAKYFRSYYRDIVKKRDQHESVEIEDCILCTNVDFEESCKLETKEFVLIPINDPDVILSSSSSDTSVIAPNRFKMSRTETLQQTMESWSTVHSLVKTLLDCVLVKKQLLALNIDVFKRYHVTLVKENIIEIIKDSTHDDRDITRREGKLSESFLQGDESLTKDVVKEFRRILENETFILYCQNLSVRNKSKINSENQTSDGEPKKKRRVDPKLQTSDEKPLEDLGKDWTSRKVTLPSYDSKSITIDFDNLFANYRQELERENVLSSNSTSKKLFTEEFLQGVYDTPTKDKALRFRKFLSNLVFIRCWKDLKFRVSGTFGESANPNKQDSGNEPLDFVKLEDINEFLDKLVFVVNMPNEVELGKILTEMVGKCYNMDDGGFQASYILEKLLDWFKEKDSKWFKSEDQQKLMNQVWQKMNSLRATSLSLDYQEELNVILSFNEAAKEEMAEKLKLLLPRCSQSEALKVTHITTAFPKLTAVKVIAALRHQIISESTKSNFERDDRYLVTSTSRLKKRSKSKWIRKALLKEGNPQQLLIVVCDDGGTRIQIVDDSGIEDDSDSEDALFSRHEKAQSLKGKGVIVIGKEETKANSLRDTINYKQLSQHTIDSLVSRTVSFQRNSFEMKTEGENEKNVTVADLIGTDEQREKVLDASSIEELMLQGEQTNIKIPSYSATAFEESLYIKREMRFWGDYDSKFWQELAESINKNKEKEKQKTSVDELQKQCKINSNTGSIEWNKDIDKELKEEIWVKIIERTRNSPQKKISEDELLVGENGERLAIIISGVAGTGKSTLLSHYYKEIKKKDPSTWVIRINLTDHQKALDGLSNSFEFLVHHIKVVGESPFARSLLKHRLESGDRIVLMLDGYDEIDWRCQKKTIQFIKSIVADKKRSMMGLFVTTRSHLVDDLQLELGQLSYYLHNFDREDQINCLTSFWKANSDESQSSDEEKEKSDRDRIAEKLVDKVTASLNDNERSFIGVPLQCRMVAECFPWRRPVELKQGPATFDGADEKLTFELNIDKQLGNFSLVKLYRLLVKKKRDIYRQEKVKAHKAESQNANQLVESAMAQLEKDLIQLAIETIVSNPEETNALLGQTQFQAEAELEEEISKRDDGGIRYGLLDVRRDGGDGTMTQHKKKVVFLHRTYAEYFVADYLYKGFHLDDKKHNKLLDNETTRDFIINKMIKHKYYEYNGVEIFFDSMLGELINDEEWRNRIKERNLPSRFFKFTREVSSQGVYALRSSFECRKEKTFLFLCDCIDATYEGQVKQAMNRAFFCEGLAIFMKPNKYRDASAKVFQRYLSYFGHEEEIKKLVARFCTTNIIYDQEESYYWDGKEQIEIVRSLLEFYKKNRLLFNHIFTKMGSPLHILPLLIWNENYHHHGHLQTYLKLLSETDKYSKDDAAFAQTIKQSNVCRKIYDNIQIWIDGRIDKTLIALRDVNRIDVVIELWPHVLKTEPEACRRYYNHQRTSNDEPATSIVVQKNEGAADVADWLKGLLDRDEFQMTRLQRAVLCNQENVESILDKVKEIVMSSEGETLALAKQVVNYMSGINEEVDTMEIKEEDWDGNCFTPLHLAILCEHGEICDAIMSFLNQVGLDEDQLKKHLIKKDGMLCLVQSRYITFIGDAKKEKVEWILKFVKGRLGQGYLLDLLKFILTKLERFDYGSLKRYFPVIKDIVVSMGPVGPLNLYDYTINEKYCEDLNFFVFQIKGYTRHLVEDLIDSATLRGMLSAKGVGDWTRRYMDSVTTNEQFGKPYGQAFEFILSSKFLGILTTDELQQLIETITEKRKGMEETPQLNYWQHFLWRLFGDFLNKNFNFFLFPNKNIDWLEWFSQLVWSVDDCKDDDRIIVNLIRLMNSMTDSGEGEDEDAEGDASREFKNEFKRLSKGRAQEMIRDVFFPSSSNPESSDIIYFGYLGYYLLELFHFYLDYGSDEQLKEFFHFVTADRHWKNEKRQSSFWAKWWPRRNDKEKIAKLFQKLSSEKMEICCPDAIRTLLIHKFDEIPFVMRLVKTEIDVHADFLAHFPQETQDVMEVYFRLNVPKMIDDFFLHPKKYLHKDIFSYGWLNGLRFFLDYADDNQLTHFIKNITTPQNYDFKNSIWGFILEVEGPRLKIREARERMDRFMRCVKEKLGQEAVMQLAMHDYECKGPFIGFLLRNNEDGEVRPMVGCLDEELQQKILLQLKKKSRGPSLQINSKN